ncbi:GntR family transcriptional regulator [Solihabitans fulvus]|uniref:GntR family transcriptional regulator n=1 Tax=Solihabitans fulvus TaxID=1892852 RepID=A0A5B2XVG0_9PSEU|nr:GntR family transcriptional regulator [Solihabitans fulvus]KAA2267145.1 GntR family transcriptional regulator [Solihabitans fulvus]
MTEPLLEGRSKAQYAYETIRQRIVSGHYGPGSRLVFDQLARDLKISPVPIREAVRQLEAQGWVVFERNIGAQVAAIDPGEYRHSMETLALLEGYAVGSAVGRIETATLDRAAELNRRMRASLEQFDPLGFTRLNREFHLLLCAACPNPHVRGLIDREWGRLDLMRRSTFSLVPGRASESVREHDELLLLLRTGEPAAVVEEFARRHKLTTVRALLPLTRLEDPT